MHYYSPPKADKFKIDLHFCGYYSRVSMKMETSQRKTIFHFYNTTISKHVTCQKCCYTRKKEFQLVYSS